MVGKASWQFTLTVAGIFSNGLTVKLNYMNTIKITEKEFNEAQRQLLNIPVVMQQSGQLFCSMAGKGFCPYEYENGKCKVEG
jgi:hypothetical protein